jgi:photoactive yellow protein
LRSRESACSIRACGIAGNLSTMAAVRQAGRDTMPASVNFAAPNLATHIERLSQFELDRLSFGVILIDGDGTVMFYSQTEAQQSGYGRVPLGQNLFAVSSCMGGDDFRGRIRRAMADGPVDLAFELPGDYGDPNRALHVRVQSARQGGVWICIAREGAAAAARASH